MKGTSHLIVGTTMSMVILKTLEQSCGINEVIIASIASLLPDIDEENSKINKYIPFTNKKFIYGILGLYMFYYMYQTKSVIMLLPAMISLLIYITGHRGFTHSITAIILFSLAFIKTPSYIYPFIIGYGMHLLCDMFNTKGLPLFYPINKRFKYPFNFSINSFPGKVIELSVVIITLILFWNILVKPLI